MNRREFQRCILGGAALAAFGGRIAAASGADSPQLTYRNPQGNAADPSILRKPTGEVVEYDGRYWLYYTSESGNVRGFEARSTRDFTSWQDEGLVFDAKGTWARPGSPPATGPAGRPRESWLFSFTYAP